MPLPSNTDLATADIAYLGQPFVQVEAKSLDTETLDIAYQAQPFVAAGPSGVIPPAGINVWANVSGVWKQASAVYVNVSGTWKSVASISTKVSATWKLS
jgi:hypothetical protein